MKSDLILANLLHLSYNMWGDWKNPRMGPFWAAQPYLRFDEKLWNDLLTRMAETGFNMVVIDIGDGIQYKSHPEIAVEHAWSHEKLKSELSRLRNMGLEPIPKCNFSACHDQWLGEYARMLSTKPYYKVCSDIIGEVIDLFDKPRFFHLGMDEEETHHQENFQYVVSRKYDLWWHDFNFLRHEVEARGVRAWIWSDYVWNHADEFYKNMSTAVVQSNWFREPVRGPAKSVYGGDIRPEVECVSHYLKLDKAGFDQVPTISNWETPDNIYNTIKFCQANLSKEHLKGYFLTPWKPTLEAARERHMDAIDHFTKAVKQYLS